MICENIKALARMLENLTTAFLRGVKKMFKDITNALFIEDYIKANKLDTTATAAIEDFFKANAAKLTDEILRVHDPNTNAPPYIKALLEDTIRMSAGEGDLRIPW